MYIEIQFNSIQFNSIIFIYINTDDMKCIYMQWTSQNDNNEWINVNIENILKTYV